ncbi:unnamed protein product [Cylicocyclus nassatus]|uniref:DNA2/NAM7 helicase helicase domain-containing protein n=1 Tax=Cylicocyclus nassatus TaxID=53992 RepID=A0AA36H900_CYLNA|nr:unnamed protein product [Cylicocyclus nassatus]
MKNVRQFARRLDGATFIDICVRLGKPLITADPAYECVSRMDLYEELKRSTTASRIIETTYGLRFLDCATEKEPALFGPIDEGYTCSLKGREIVLTEDQHKALALAFSDLPIAAIQAAFGTGKTVVGALAAALIARKTPVLVTASTNAAVAQFAETLLSLDNQNHLAVVRYLSDTAAAENNSPTSADLGELLKELGTRYAEQLTADELDLCSAFQSGREVLERYLDDPDLVFRMTEEDREEYFISERFVSRNVQKMVDLLFRLMKPNVILATTSSMLNVSGPGGIFKKHVEGFKVLIGDEASQIPEPVLMALAVRLPARRHVYIGDVHQLEPHAKWPRSSNPVRFGAQSVMSVLTRARAVPVAPLLTTFRAHPDLIELPNRVAYNGELVSGLRREDRQMLLSDGISKDYFENPRAWPIRAGFGEKLQGPVTDRRRL